MPFSSYRCARRFLITIPPAESHACAPQINRIRALSHLQSRQLSIRSRWRTMLIRRRPHVRKQHCHVYIPRQLKIARAPRDQHNWEDPWVDELVSQSSHGKQRLADQSHTNPVQWILEKLMKSGLLVARVAKAKAPSSYGIWKFVAEVA